MDLSARLEPQMQCNPENLRKKKSRRNRQGLTCTGIDSKQVNRDGPPTRFSRYLI
jgi:hypothetical protein